MADLIERDTEYIAILETLDNGKTYASAVGDIKYSVAFLRYYAGWCDKIVGITIPTGIYIQSYKIVIIIISLLGKYSYVVTSPTSMTWHILSRTIPTNLQKILAIAYCLLKDETKTIVIS